VKLIAYERASILKKININNDGEAHQRGNVKTGLGRAKYYRDKSSLMR